MSWATFFGPVATDGVVAFAPHDLSTAEQNAILRTEPATGDRLLIAIEEALGFEPAIKDEYQPAAQADELHWWREKQVLEEAGMASPVSDPLAAFAREMETLPNVPRWVAPWEARGLPMWEAPNAPPPPQPDELRWPPAPPFIVEPGLASLAADPLAALAVDIGGLPDAPSWMPAWEAPGAPLWEAPGASAPPPPPPPWGEEGDAMVSDMPSSHPCKQPNLRCAAPSPPPRPPPEEPRTMRVSRGGGAEAEPSMTAEEALAAAEREGLTLVKTGKKGRFKGVSPDRRKYSARVWRNGTYVRLGSFATAEQAALVYARTPESHKQVAAAAGEEALAEEALAAKEALAEEALAAAEREGLTLVKTDTKGQFKGVTVNKTSKSTPYVATCGVYLGSFATAEQAALVYARTSESRKQKRPRRMAAPELGGGSSNVTKQPRHTPPQEADDDQVRSEATPALQASHRRRKVTHARDTDTAAEQVGAERVPIILDTTEDWTMFYRSDEVNQALLGWIDRHVASDANKTLGGKYSKVFKRDSEAFNELIGIVQPMLDKAGLCLAEVNGLLYKNGQISMILPHRDSHHNLLERLTIIFDITQCAKGDTLHMDIPGHGHRRVPDAKPGQQFCAVLTSAANVTHWKVVGVNMEEEMEEEEAECEQTNGDVVTLALWCFLGKHKKELLELHDASKAGPATHLSGMSSVVHDVDVCDTLRDQPRIDVRHWPEGRPEVLKMVQDEQARLATERKDSPPEQSPRPESMAVDLPSFQGHEAFEYAVQRVQEARAAAAAPMMSQPEQGSEDESASASLMEVGGAAPPPSLPPMPALVSADEVERNPPPLFVARGGDAALFFAANPLRPNME